MHRPAAQLVLLAVLAVLLSAASTGAQRELPRMTTARVIDAAHESGEIDDVQTILLKAYSIYAPDRLPETYRGGLIDKCGTPTVREIHDALPTLPLDIADVIRGLRDRPSTQTYVDTEHFRVHYDTMGSYKVFNWPSTTYRDAVLAAAEHSWGAEVDTMDFRQPPDDSGDPDGGGGNGLYDIYIQNTGDYYGWTQQCSLQPGDPPNDCSSFVVIDNDYQGFGYVDRTEPMKVTVAHEFNHACQMAHDCYEDIWYMECSAVWAEDEVYDEIDDYVQYVSSFLSSPHLTLEAGSGGYRMYGSVIWNKFLSENHGQGIVPDIWDECEVSSGPSIDVIISTLVSYGTTIQEEFGEFAIWNWFTADRDDGAHYEEGSTWPAVVAEDSCLYYPVTGGAVPPEKRPEHLACNYIRFDNSGSGYDSLTIAYDGTGVSSWEQRVNVNVEPTSGDTYEYGEITLNAFGEGEAIVEDWGDITRAWLVVSNLSTATDDLSYTYDVEEAAIPAPLTPDPMTWLDPPSDLSESSISMVCTGLQKGLAPYEYVFEFVGSPTGGAGGTGTGWITESHWTDDDLSVNHQYAYRCAGRDVLGTTVGWSTESSAFTDIEACAGIEFGMNAYTSIRARSIHTPSGLTRGSSGLIVRNTTEGTDSGWKQDNDYWECSGLAPNTGYLFTAQSRNGDAEVTPATEEVLKYTLPAYPLVLCDIEESVPYPEGTVFTFSNGRPWGEGGVEHYHCVFDTSATTTPGDTDPEWSDSDLELTPTEEDWYLHVLSHNVENLPGGVVHYGPYVVRADFRYLSLEFQNGQNRIDLAPSSVCTVTIYASGFEPGEGTIGAQFMLERSFGGLLLDDDVLLPNGIAIGDPETGWEVAGSCDWPDGDGRVALARIVYAYMGPAGTLEITGHPTKERRVFDCSSGSQYWCVPRYPSGHGGINVPPPPGVCGPPAPPDIHVTPASLALALAEEAYGVEFLCIGNRGGEVLLWSVVDSFDVDCPLVMAYPETGAVAPGDSQTVALEIYAMELPVGVHECDLLIESNDPSDPEVAIPITLTVLGDATAIIDTNPDHIDGAWQMTGPGGYDLSASGDTVLAYLVFGEYTCTWLPDTSGGGFTAPVPVAHVIAPGETAVFTGDYWLRPDIDIQPSSLSFEVAQGDTGCSQLGISNHGNMGAIDLVWSVSHGGCTWLAEDPSGGAVPQGETHWVDVCADAGSLAPGDYDCQLVFDAPDDDDEPQTIIPVSLAVAPATAVDDPAAFVPSEFRFWAATPNPFNPATTIQYDLPEPAVVWLCVYDVQGRLVRVLEDDVPRGAGRHHVVWDGCNESGDAVASGTYVCGIEAGPYSGRGKLTLLK